MSFCLTHIVKSEVILMGTRQRSVSFPSLSNISVASSTVPFSPQVKLLGVTLDNSLSLNKHVASVSKACFFHLRTLRHIRHTLTDDAAKTIASSLVGHDLTTLTPYWLAHYPKTSTGCNTSRTHWRGLSWKYHTTKHATWAPSIYFQLCTGCQFGVE